MSHFQAMANYELAADYYKGEESNRYPLLLLFGHVRLYRLGTKDTLVCIYAC